MRNEWIEELAQEVYSRATDGDAGSGHYEYPYSKLQHVGFFILFFFPSIAFVIFCLRIYGRFSAKQIGWDDYIISVAMAMSIAETGCSYRSMRTAFIGVHYYDIPPQADWVLAEKWNFTIQLLYNPILAIVKTSALLFLLRLGGQKTGVRKAIFGLIIFNLALMVSIFIACILQCKPVSYFWNKAAVNPPEGKCFDMNAFYVATASLTILTDILVLLLPFWIFIGLKLPLRVRLALIGVFFTGGVVTIMSILRLAWLIQTAYFETSKDPTHDIRFTYSAVETNLAIICACAPALRPLFMKWFPRLFSSLKSNSNNKYTHDQYGRSSDKRSRTTTAIRSGHHNESFALKDMKGRSQIRGHSPTTSEEEIMTYNGILKTSEVAVDYADKESSRAGDEAGVAAQPRYGFGGTSSSTQSF